MEGGSGHTALHLSVHHRAVSAVQILARHGANVNAVNSSGMTPLHMAAGLLHKELVAGLIKVGADVNMVCVAVVLIYHIWPILIYKLSFSR